MALHETGHPTRQRPLGSGFTAAATAADVVGGLDLTGTNVVVTGGHSGIGLEATRALAGAGASVTVGARTRERAASALAGIAGAEAERLDLLDPASIDAFAGRWAGSGRPLHVLVNNAAVQAPEELTLDARGYEMQFATNHLGHLQLTLGLLPALRAAGGARVVTVSSGGHRLSGIRWDDPHFARGYDGVLAYGQSKTANILFTVELDRRFAGEGIRGFAVHPGIVVSTALAGAPPDDQLRAMDLIDDDGLPIIDPAREKKTPQQGASTTVFAATSPLLAGLGGVYLKDNDVSPLDENPVPISFGTGEIVASDVVPYAVDPESGRRLWELSERLLGVRAGG